MAIKINLTTAPYVIPQGQGIVGVPLPQANELLGVNQAASDWQGWLLQAGSNVEIVRDDVARTITINSTGEGGGGEAITVSAGNGITVNQVGNDYAVSTTHPTVSAGTNVTVSHVGDDYEVSATGIQEVVAGDNITIDQVGDTVTINATVPSGVAVLNDLTDVVITSATTGDVLEFNGTNWVNAQPSGGSGITATSTDTLSNKTIDTVDNTIKINGWTLSSTAPTLTVYAAAGTGRSASVSGSAFAFQLTLNTGTGVVGDDFLVGFTYGFSSPNGYVVQLTPSNKAAAELSGAKSVYVVAVSATLWRLYGATTPLSDSTTYKWNVHVYG